MGNLNVQQQQMVEYIELFLTRQKLVFQALLDIRPNLLISVGLLKPEARPKRASLSDTGLWGENQEWKYFRHGLGLRLFNTVTKEPIEWNAAPDGSFDCYWFSNWLYWFTHHDLRSKQELIANKPEIEFRAYIFNLLTELLEVGVLRQESPAQMPNEYTLVNP